MGNMKLNQILFILLAFVVMSCGKTAKEEQEAKSNGKTLEKSPSVNATLVKNEDDTKEEIDPSQLAKFEFEEESFDFGDITQGDEVEHTFKFKNVGEVPLVITDTKVTC